MSLELTAPESWICDTCGNRINGVAEGSFEFIQKKKDDWKLPKYHSFRIVHSYAYSSPKGRCIYDEDAIYKKDGSLVGSLNLSRLVGPDGLVELLSLLRRAECIEELSVIILRLQIPGYEEAMPHFSQALDEGVIEQRLEDGLYDVQQIENVLKHYHADT